MKKAADTHVGRAVRYIRTRVALLAQSAPYSIYPTLPRAQMWIPCPACAYICAPTAPARRAKSALRLDVSPWIARASSLQMPREMRCVWWVKYEMGRGHEYLVRSRPARAILELRCMAATAGGEKPPPIDCM